MTEIKHSTMKRYILNLALGLLVMGVATGCTDDFEQLNTDQHAATDQDMERDGKLRIYLFIVECLISVM